MKRTYWYAEMPQGTSGDRVCASFGQTFDSIGTFGAGMATVTAMSHPDNVRPTGLSGSSPG